MNQVKSEAPADYNVIDLDTHNDDSIIEQALDILAGRMTIAGAAMTNPADTIAYLKLQFNGAERELFSVMFLDTQHRLISFQTLFQGTIDGANVSPREVVKAALGCNAAAVILSHNHPSGVSEPSMADRHITGRLKEALALIDVRVLDHIVVCPTETTSLAERGMM